MKKIDVHKAKIQIKQKIQDYLYDRMEKEQKILQETVKENIQRKYEVGIIACIDIVDKEFENLEDILLNENELKNDPLSKVD